MLLFTEIIDFITSHSFFSEMISHNSINGLRCHGNKHVITDILKNELGFKVCFHSSYSYSSYYFFSHIFMKGFTVSDWGGVDNVEGADYKAKVALSINSGLDMIISNTRWNVSVKALKVRIHSFIF
jgi:beta-glucosidase